MRRAILISMLALPVLPCVSAAGYPGNVKHEDKVGVAIHFSDSQRESYRNFASERGKACPPGLAKKNNGCLPPGQAKKRYVVGRPLSAEIVIQPVSGELSKRLGRPPSGFLYAEVDGDLLQLAVGTLLVVDAIEGLSH